MMTILNSVDRPDAAAVTSDVYSTRIRVCERASNAGTAAAHSVPTAAPPIAGIIGDTLPRHPVTSRGIIIFLGLRRVGASPSKILGP